MHLIQTLAAGVEGAADGFVGIFVRGTSQRATYYADFEGDTAVLPSADIALDGNGAAEIYVDRFVDVVVKDSLGVTVMEFTVGSHQSLIECITPSFLGTDYETAQTAANKPTTLKAILDRVITSFGGTDWNLLFGGSEITMQAFATILTGFIYNVKNVTYGAAGDGVTDDTAAIQAAIDDATGDSGGVVFFPQGTYRITDALDVPYNVQLWGAGAGVTLINIDHASRDLVQFSGGSPAVQYVQDIQFGAAQNNSGTHLSVDVGGAVSVERCVVGNSKTQGFGIQVIGDEAMVYASRSRFQVSGSGARCIYANPVTISDHHFYVDRCTFRPHETQNADLVTIKNGAVTNCWFDNSPATAGTYDCIALDAVEPRVSFSGNRFSYGGGAVVTCYNFGTISSDDAVQEDESVFEEQSASYIPYAYTATGSTAAVGKIRLGTREHRKQYIQSDAPFTLDDDVYGTIVIERTDNTGAHQLASGGVAPEGSKLTVIIYNSGAGAPSNRFDTNFAYEDSGAPYIVVPAGEMCAIRFRSVCYSGTTLRWVQDGAMCPVSFAT